MGVANMPEHAQHFGKHLGRNFVSKRGHRQPHPDVIVTLVYVNIHIRVGIGAVVGMVDGVTVAIAGCFCLH